MIYFTLAIALGFGLFIPAAAFAAFSNILGLESYLYEILSALSMLFWVMAIAFFMWGVIKFIANTDDPAKREEGKKFLVWSVIAFLVLVSIWGIVRFLLVDTIGIMPGSTNVVFIDKNGVPV